MQPMPAPNPGLALISNAGAVPFYGPVFLLQSVPLGRENDM